MKLSKVHQNIETVYSILQDLAEQVPDFITCVWPFGIFKVEGYVFNPETIPPKWVFVYEHHVTADLVVTVSQWMYWENVVKEYNYDMEQLYNNSEIFDAKDPYKTAKRLLEIFTRLYYDSEIRLCFDSIAELASLIDFLEQTFVVSCGSPYGYTSFRELVENNMVSMEDQISYHENEEAKFRYTREWAFDNNKDPYEIVKYFDDCDIECDCQILTILLPELMNSRYSDIGTEIEIQLARINGEYEEDEEEEELVEEIFGE